MNDNILKLALPKGRMCDEVLELLKEAGIDLKIGARAYRPTISLDNVQVKLLKPQNIVEMLAAGSRDLGFAGADWVEELDANVVEILNTGLNPVRIVAAAPSNLLVNNKLPKQQLTVASEYEQITKKWITKEKLLASFVRTYGATEVFPPRGCRLHCRQHSNWLHTSGKWPRNY